MAAYQNKHRYGRPLFPCFPQAAVAALSSLCFFFLCDVILSCAPGRKNPTVIVSFPRIVWFCGVLRIQGVMVCCDILSVCSLEWLYFFCVCSLHWLLITETIFVLAFS
ncbi:hypothetical protein VPH35_057463 [Triticum aestivum]